MFVAALDAEGVPADGRFYEPVYRSDLFHASADDFPQLKLGREEPVDYRKFLVPGRRTRRLPAKASGCRNSCCWAMKAMWTKSRRPSRRWPATSAISKPPTQSSPRSNP
jgi:hypothetical protein